ncbi:MAG: hypothetical protein ACM3VS_08895 [Candidatus Dadabacteria bacterium]
MTKNILYWVRWVAVLPLGFAAVWLIALLLKLLMYYVIFVFFAPGSTTTLQGYILTVTSAATFVYAGSLIAPGKDESKMHIVLAFFALIVILYAILHLTGATIFGFGIHFLNGWLTLTLAILGACIGFSLSMGGRKAKVETAPHKE